MLKNNVVIHKCGINKDGKIINTTKYLIFLIYFSITIL